MPFRNGQTVKWKVKIKYLRNAILDAEDTEEGAEKLGKKIYRILSSKAYSKYFEDFEIQQGWELEDFCSACKQDDLNSMLDELYDYCDGALIWIE